MADVPSSDVAAQVDEEFDFEEIRGHYRVIGKIGEGAQYRFAFRRPFPPSYRVPI